MTKTEARKKVNQLKAIDDGLGTLVGMAYEVDPCGGPLTLALIRAKAAARKDRDAIESYHGVEASVTLPFKKGKKS